MAHVVTFWDDVVQLNLKALFFMSQAAARAMARQGGGKIERSTAIGSKAHA